jgi:hypothetical protein
LLWKSFDGRSDKKGGKEGKILVVGKSASVGQNVTELNITGRIHWWKSQ